MMARPRRVPIRHFDPTTPYAPHVVLPGQGGGVVEITPARALMLEVLLTAVRDLRNVWSGRMQGRRARRLYRNARAWLFSDTRAWPFAAANLCDHLQIDLTAVRRGIHRMETHHGPTGRDA